jgi:hypothetical protein
MKAFTMLDLARQPARVLDACDLEGSIRIRRRNGSTYRLIAERQPARMRIGPDFVRRHLVRTAKLFPKPVPAQQARLVDKLLAGE